MIGLFCFWVLADFLDFCHRLVTVSETLLEESGIKLQTQGGWVGSVLGEINTWHASGGMLSADSRWRRCCHLRGLLFTSLLHHDRASNIANGTVFGMDFLWSPILPSKGVWLFGLSYLQDFAS
jgi:hypothetical protein